MWFSLIGNTQNQLPITNYSGSRLSEVQEPHPQPPPRLQGGGYYVPHMIRKRYTNYQLPITNYQLPTSTDIISV
ncbi:hypothetical protein JYQ62_20760 [Nostoc sp. UHCC 0702]|nr:hypothetical protein JYQ62_20760 [Nostoc sp. UHCC 0702]